MIAKSFRHHRTNYLHRKKCFRDHWLTTAVGDYGQ